MSPGMSARAKGIETLSVTEKDRLLAFLHDQLTSELDSRGTTPWLSGNNGLSGRIDKLYDFHRNFSLGTDGAMNWPAEPHR